MSDCEHSDVRYFKDEGGAIACMVCGRLFGHLVDGWMHPHNVIRIDPSIVREAERNPGAYKRARLAFDDDRCTCVPAIEGEGYLISVRCPVHGRKPALTRGAMPDNWQYTEEAATGPFCICGKRSGLEAEVERLEREAEERNLTIRQLAAEVERLRGALQSIAGKRRATAAYCQAVARAALKGKPASDEEQR